MLMTAIGRGGSLREHALPPPAAELGWGTLLGQAACVNTCGPTPQRCPGSDNGDLAAT